MLRKIKIKKKTLLISKVLFLFLILLISVHGFFLYFKIKKRINGKVWTFPAALYGRIVTLEPGMQYNMDDIIILLKSTQYRQVENINFPGEFTVYGNSVEIMRRAFCFPDIKEKNLRVKLNFKKNILYEIKNVSNDLNFSFFRLDPLLMTMLDAPHGKQRLFVPYADFPQSLINILIEIEDKNFYHHNGIEFFSIIRAFFYNIYARRMMQGGSTLTQQLVKNIFLTNKKSFWRKINEIYMAIILDAIYSKNRILELYLNEVYLGQNGNAQIHGFALASLYYFARPINELRFDQQALLVGMVKGASLYNPWKNKLLALKRRNLILSLAEKKNIINKSLYGSLIQRALDVQTVDANFNTQKLSFMQMVYDEVYSKLSLKKINDVKIFTTLDTLSQNSAEQAVKKGIPFLKKKSGIKDLEVSIVVLDKFTGEIRALVGGANSFFSGYNRALKARRSIGSLAKPVIFLTALNQLHKYHLNSWINDVPIILKKSNKTWIPKNQDQKFSGKVMLLDALIHSINIPTVYLGVKIGLKNIMHTWKILGISKNALKSIPSVLLGSINLTPIEISQVFQTIANEGNRALLSTLRFILSEKNKLIYQNFPQSENVISKQAAYLILYAMQKVVTEGTAHILGKKFPHIHIAAKTGTTNNLIDSWFIGIDGKEVTVIWLGRDNNHSTKLYGASGAMQIYNYYLEYKHPTPLILSIPENIHFINIDSNGNLICKKKEKWKKIPIWILNKKVVCAK